MVFNSIVSFYGFSPPSATSKPNAAATNPKPRPEKPSSPEPTISTAYPAKPPPPPPQMGSFFSNHQIHAAAHRASALCSEGGEVRFDGAEVVEAPGVPGDPVGEGEF